MPTSLRKPRKRSQLMSKSLTYTFKGERELPAYLEKLIASAPPRGGGLHQWLFRAALHLQRFRSERESIIILKARTIGKPLKSNEIEEAVKNSRRLALSQGSTPNASLPKKWPDFNEEQRHAVFSREGGLIDLLEKSPVRCEETAPQAEEVIDQLMPPDCWICAGRSQQGAVTKSRSEWRGGLAQQEFVVPSPMLSSQGITKDGKISYRSLNNVAPRRFLVIDQDSGTMDEQAGVLSHLARIAPLVMVVSTGGRGLHGWFYCAKKRDEQLWPFMRMAVILGACRSTWSPIQLVRMPGGLREGSSPQPVLLFNPGVIR